MLRIDYHREDFRIFPDETLGAIIWNGKEINYGELFALSEGLNPFLNRLCLRNGERLCIMAKNGPMIPVLCIALWKRGAVPLLLSTKLNDDEVASAIEGLGVRHILREADIHMQEANFRASCEIQGRLSKEALILFTSGSTGKPKAVSLSFQSLIGSVESLDSYMPLNRNLSQMGSLPFCHIGGFQTFIRALLSSSRLIIPEDLSTGKIACCLKEWTPSFISLVPTMLKRLLDSGLQLAPDTKAVFIGGGPSDQDLIENALKKNIPVYRVYGSTETSSMVAIADPGELKIDPSRSGREMPGVRILLNDRNELLVNSRSIALGYLNGAEEWGRKYCKGFYNTSDLGRIDQDGFLHINSRREDLIITGGENVSPQEVNNALMNLGLFEEVSVFALDNEEWGQMVSAALVPLQGTRISIYDINRLLHERLAGYKVPKLMFFLEELPRSDLGKVNLSRLKDMALKGQQSFSEIIRKRHRLPGRPEN